MLNMILTIGSIYIVTITLLIVVMKDCSEEGKKIEEDLNREMRLSKYGIN